MNLPTSRQEAGVALVNDLNEHLARIREQATQAARRTTDIIAATWEQDAATQAIARHVENIAQR